MFPFGVLISMCARKSHAECWPFEKGFPLCKLTNTFDAISHPAFSAAALEASGDIQTWGMHVAVVGTNFTLIHIWETRVKKEKMKHELIKSTSKYVSVRQQFRINAGLVRRNTDTAFVSKSFSTPVRYKTSWSWPNKSFSPRTCWPLPVGRRKCSCCPLRIWVAAPTCCKGPFKTPWEVYKDTFQERLFAKGLYCSFLLIFITYFHEDKNELDLKKSTLHFKSQCPNVDGVECLLGMCKHLGLTSNITHTQSKLHIYSELL